jgi:transposase
LHDLAKTQNYSKETQERAVRLVREHSGDSPSERAAMTAVARRLGIGSAETPRKWVRQAETDEGQRPGLTTAVKKADK